MERWRAHNPCHGEGRPSFLPHSLSQITSAWNSTLSLAATHPLRANNTVVDTKDENDTKEASDAENANWCVKRE